MWSSTFGSSLRFSTSATSGSLDSVSPNCSVYEDDIWKLEENLNRPQIYWNFRGSKKYKYEVGGFKGRWKKIIRNICTATLWVLAGQKIYNLSKPRKAPAVTKSSWFDWDGLTCSVWLGATLMAVMQFSTQPATTERRVRSGSSSPPVSCCLK